MERTRRKRREMKKRRAMTKTKGGGTRGRSSEGAGDVHDALSLLDALLLPLRLHPPPPPAPPASPRSPPPHPTSRHPPHVPFFLPSLHSSSSPPALPLCPSGQHQLRNPPPPCPPPTPVLSCPPLLPCPPSSLPSPVENSRYVGEGGIGQHTNFNRLECSFHGGFRSALLVRCIGSR